MSSASTIEQRRSSNRQHLCNASSCSRGRRGVSAFCATHERARNLYGHPNGHALLRREYRTQLAEVTAFFASNKAHPSTVAALDWIARQLKTAADGGALVAGYMWVRLSRRNVAPMAILSEAAAVWLYASRNRWALPDDERLTYALGIAVLQLVPMETYRAVTVTGRATRGYRRLNGTNRRSAGRVIRNVFGVMFMRMDESMVQSANRRESLRETLGMHFVASEGT